MYEKLPSMQKVNLFTHFNINKFICYYVRIDIFNMYIFKTEMNKNDEVLVFKL